MKFTSSAQAGQDLFCAHILAHKRNGSFIDVGASEPVDISNTYALETYLGWRGLLLDISPQSIDRCRETRKSFVILADATKYDFRPELSTSPQVIDYLSFDTDEAQVPALVNFLRAADDTKTLFRVLTVETDRYRFGDAPRGAIVAMLRGRGYELIADDVKSQGCEFETWWVRPELVDMTVADKFRSVGLEWQDVLRRGGAL